jgi:hypothetical protein
MGANDHIPVTQTLLLLCKGTPDNRGKEAHDEVSKLSRDG